MSKRWFYFLAKPRRMACGKYYCRFYSRHNFPWYQASVIVEKPSDVFKHFEDFKQSARKHCNEST